MVGFVRALIFLAAMLAIQLGFAAATIETTPADVKAGASVPPAAPPATPGALPPGTARLVIPAAILIGIAAALAGGDPDDPGAGTGTGTGTR